MADIEKKALDNQELGDVAGGGAGGMFWENNGAIYYTIVNNDTLSEIAKRAQVPMQQILRLNPSIKNPDLIRLGDVIRIR